MKKKGFSLVEISIVLAIVGILFLTGVNVYRQTHLNSQIDACEADLRDAATGFQSYMTDYGKLVFPANPDTYEDAVTDLIDILNTRYLVQDITLVSVADDYTGFTATTATDTDPWKSLYTLNVYTNDGSTGIDIGTNIPGLIVISSPGPNALSNISDYESDYSDDIIAVIDPLIEE